MTEYAIEADIFAVAYAKVHQKALKINIEYELCSLQIGVMPLILGNINKQKTIKMMTIRIPFDHIKVLDNGNYGCTLKMGSSIFCAVCTPEWDWIEPLHESTFDPNWEYSYIRDSKHLVLSSYYYNMELHKIDPMLIDLLDIRQESMLNTASVDITDYFSDAPSTNDDFQLALFTIRYIDQDGNFAFEIPDALVPYSIMSRAAIGYAFDLYAKCNFDKDAIIQELGIAYDSKNPLAVATLGMIEQFEKIGQMFDSSNCTLTNRSVLDFAALLLTFDNTTPGLFDFARIVYQKYLSPHL